MRRSRSRKAYGHHDYFGHDHLNFDVEAGRNEFLTEVNRIFAQNGLVFDL
jgi:hypothetical protein